MTMPSTTAVTAGTAGAPAGANFSAPPQPTRKCEMELYQLLNKANLLQYFEAFITQGGDDIRQLHDASEEEFLEITVLVGMASKPLHVRRLQKHLSEWYKNHDNVTSSLSHCSNGSHLPTNATSLAQSDLVQRLPSPIPDQPPPKHSSSSTQPSHMHFVPAQTQPFNVNQPALFPSNTSSMLSGSKYYNGIMSEFSAVAAAASAISLSASSAYGSDSPISSGGNGPGRPRSQHNGEGVPVSMLPNAELTAEQLHAMMLAAKQLVGSLPQYPVKPLNPRKQLHRDIEAVIHMSVDDPHRLEQIRKFSAIYGRFDALRKTGKPMSLHEVSVNEAAAQICFHMPSLLTRRDDLFPLARQVVKMAGIQNPSATGTCATSPGASATLYQTIQHPTVVQSNSSMLNYSPSMFAGGHPALLMQSNSRAMEAHNQTASKRLRLFNSMDDQSSFSESFPPQLDRLTIESRLESIKVELAEVIGKSDEIRESIRSVKTTGDTALLTRLQKCSDLLSIRHNNLLQEQTGLLRSLQHFQASANMIGSGSGVSSDNSSDKDCRSRDVRDIGATGAHRSHCETTSEPSTLFEDGMRLAQQFGFDELATEIKELKSAEEDDSRDGKLYDVVIDINETDDQDSNILLQENDSDQIELPNGVVDVDDTSQYDHCEGISDTS